MDQWGKVREKWGGGGGVIAAIYNLIQQIILLF